MQAPYSSPVPRGSFGFLAVLLTLIGLAITAVFFLAITPRKSRSIVLETLTAVVAAGFLGFGGLFMFLWAGIYV